MAAATVTVDDPLIVHSEQFVPFTLSFTVTTPEEAAELWQRLNVSSASAAQQGGPHTANDLMSMFPLKDMHDTLLVNRLWNELNSAMERRM